MARHLIAVLLLVAIASRGVAWADDAGAGSGTSGFNAHASDGNGGPAPAAPIGGDATGSLGTYHERPVCALSGGAVCHEGSLCADGSPQIFWWYVDPSTGITTDSGFYCPGEDTPAPAPQLTIGMIARAFQRIPLPASPLNIQPPNGRTLVNFDTNFFTEDQSFDRTVRLLGRRIDLHITVSAYTWHFDDGEQLTTSEPGAPYPHLQITHSYLRTGDYGPTLDTTYVADYRVDGGAWRTVPGSVTIEGDPEQLTAVEARPILVGYGS